MSPGRHEDGLLERGCRPEDAHLAPQLEEDIGRAARTGVPVLITGAPEEGREIACAIDRRSPAPRGAVDVVDCRQRGAFTRAMSYAPVNRAPRGTSGSILLLQEVHALSLDEQEQIDHRLAELRSSESDGAVRIMASSSAPLFERVLEGAFDERLYYRLAVIHMVVA
jgi:DNA-binding NtrC family response regulator